MTNCVRVLYNIDIIRLFVHYEVKEVQNGRVCLVRVDSSGSDGLAIVPTGRAETAERTVSSTSPCPCFAAATPNDR